MKNWLMKNKVFLVGLLSAVALAVYEILQTAGGGSAKVFIFAGLLALTGYLAKNLRGQIATMAGLIGNALAVIATQETLGNVMIAQLILQILIGYLAAVAAPAKSTGYEQTPMIEAAKKQGEEIQPKID